MLKILDNNNNTKLLHLYSTFTGTQTALHSKGESPHPPRVQHPPG